MKSINKTSLLLASLSTVFDINDHNNPLNKREDNTSIYKTLPLTNKQRKARAKSKRGKLSRQINRK